MTRKKIAIVDYGVGNLTSVYRTFQALGHRCVTSSEHFALAESDVIVLPGVGAFPTAMSELNKRGLTDFLRDRAQMGHPMIGICLGMQLLADESLEHGTTAGLGLIPGQVVPLDTAHWHIGWNTIEVVNNDKLLSASDGDAFYFNHSYIFNAPVEYQVCVSRLRKPFAAAVRRKNVVGLQFHPEKSQSAGRKMLNHLIQELTIA